MTWFGGKSRAAALIWPRFGDASNYIEPFAGSLAALLGRPHEPRVETVNDIDCVAPETRILRADLAWARAGDIHVGDRLIGFDEHNGEAREGLRAPTRYRRLAHSTVTAVRVLRKPSYRLTFDHGTSVVASANHLWLGGSHKSGGRGWRWVKTENMVCNRKAQRSWVLKVADVHGVEDSWEAGWLGGFIDGEGSLRAGPGLRLAITQNEGPALDQAQRLLAERGYASTRTKQHGGCRLLQVGGGIAATLSLLMRVRPERLIRKLPERLSSLSLYGRQHRAVGLVSKEFLGECTVVAIETDCHTFIAEGLASHNCYIANFWRAVAAVPDEVARHADWPVNEADLHARHRWLVETAADRIARVRRDPDYYDAKVAGWWVWGQCLWIGSGWCAPRGYRGRMNGDRGGVLTVQKRPAASGNGQAGGVHRRWNSGGAGAGQGVHAPTLSRKKPQFDRGGRGSSGPSITRLSRQIPVLRGDGGSVGNGLESARIIDATDGLYGYMRDLAARLRRVRVCCGDWTRVLTPSVTTYIGLTAVLLDPPYDQSRRSICYNEDQDISADVRAWALAHGDDPKFRIALCGYEGEHAMPASWERVPWTAGGGYGRSARGKGNRTQERIWFSKFCLKPGLFGYDEATA